MRTSRIHVIAVASALTLIATAAESARVEGIEFPDELMLGEQPLELRGTALLRYRIIFRAYAAALYLKPDTNASRVLDDVPRRLEIEYFWSIPASGFIEATLDGIRKNVDAETWERLGPKIEQFEKLYRDVEPGDRYQLTYLPNVGTELALNGTSQGRVEGAEFSRALFSIWLGAEPFDESLKRQLLGGR
jgi:hypothetical protein